MTTGSGGQALANARKFTRYDQGMCLAFVRGEAWHIGSLYGSAIEAWNAARYRHPGDRNPPVGAPCFYSGGKYGHIVVAGDRDGLMRSTDCTSTGHVSDADLDWPVHNWGDTYLGWTEDLNGVQLPLGDDEMNQEDWDKLRGIVHDEVEQGWATKMTVTQPGTGGDTTKARQQVLRELWQKVTRAT